MQLSEAEARALKQAGVDALRRGDFADARARFENVADDGQADGLTWLGLAAACRGLKDAPATLAAVDRILALEPRNVRALIMKGDQLADLGDVPSALSFYRAARKSAATAGRLPPDLVRDLQRVEETGNRFAAAYETFLRERLAVQGYDNRRSSRRFAQSLDLVHGKKQLYQQQPRHYYFPELPQKQFNQRSDFPWLAAVEASTADIRKEAEQILKDQAAFSPYVTREQKDRRPHSDQLGMLDNPDWSACFLWKDGRVVPNKAERCPKTLQALENVPLSRSANRMPSILFSLLRPGTRIPPHTGLLNSRLICHLPLIVPANCRFRVGNDVREWIEGEAFVFDDTIEHEAWNQSEQIRVVLIFEIWRPELTPEEQILVRTFLEATDDYGGASSAWNE